MTLAVLVLDVLTLLLVGLCVWFAAMKGFIRTVAQVLVYIAILGLSSYGSGKLAPIIYDRAIAPMVTERLEQQRQSMENALLTTVENVLDSGNISTEVGSAPPASDLDVSQSTEPSILQQLLDWIRSLFQKEQISAEDAPIPEETKDGGMGILPEVLRDLPLEGLDDISIDGIGETLLEDLLEQSIRPIAVAAVTAVCFVVLFSVLSLAANILLRMLGVIDHIPVLGRVNRMMGGVLGFVEGLLLVWLVGLFLRGVLALNNGSWWIFTFSSLRSGILFPLLSEPMWMISRLGG